jgi:hypothetical protein
MDTNIMEKPAISISKHNKFLLTTGTWPPSVTFQKNATEAHAEHLPG